MVDRTITTYTFLDSLCELGIKQLDLYVPLVCKSIIVHDAKEVTRESLITWFSEDYGMKKVYQGVFDTLIKKMSPKYLTRSAGKYTVNMPAVVDLASKHQERDISVDFNTLLQSIQKFAADNYKADLELEEVQNGVLAFLHSRDGDFLFQQEKALETLKKQKDGKTTATKLKYIISQFVIWSKDNQFNSFSLFVKLSKGHALTSILTMKDVSSYAGKMRDVTIAIDTPIVFNLLGLNYQTNLDLEKELIEVLKKQEAGFILFQQHYQEVKQSLSSAIYLLTTKNYNLDKASRLLRYAVKNQIPSHVLRAKLQQLDAVLERYGITVVSAPESELGYKEIDSAHLEELLEKRYSEGNPSELDDNTKRIIATDVDVVSYIYRMRGRNVATNLKNCRAMLVTTNTALAYASKHPDLSDICHSIPVCLTDVFLSTALWFNFPAKDTDVNEKVLISECYKNITLSDDILQRFYHDVEKLNSDNPLSEEQILDANTSEIVMDLLESKTFNDENLYTDLTAAEILEELELKRKKELKDKEGRLSKVESNSLKRSKTIATVLYTILWIVLVILFLFLKYIDYSNWKGWGILFNVLSILPALWGLLSWGGWIWPKANVIDRISYKVYNLLYKDLDT